MADGRNDGQHPGDSSRGAEKLADTKLRRPGTAELDAGFCDVLPGRFDDTGMGSLLPACETAGWAFWIR